VDFYLVNDSLNLVDNNTYTKYNSGIGTSSNNNYQPSDSGSGNHNPPSPKDNSLVTKTPDNSNCKSKGISPSISTNSMSSLVSYTSTDLAADFF